MSEKNGPWKKRLVKVEDTIWMQMKARAAVEQRPLFAVLATACREYLKAAKQRKIA
jgi:hypothetical protein